MFSKCFLMVQKISNTRESYAHRFHRFAQMIALNSFDTNEIKIKELYK